MPRPPPSLSIQLKGLSDQEPMITSNDLFYTTKGPGEWPSSPKYIGQLSSAPKARKEVHTPDDCGRTHSLPIVFSPGKSGATKTEAETEAACLPFCKALKESHFSSTLNAFHELEMGVGLLFSSSIYQRACCHPVGSFSNQNAFPSTDFFSPIMGEVAALLFSSQALYVAAPAHGFFPKSVHPPSGPIASML